MKLPGINCYLLALSLLISGCFEAAPPKGFDAVVPEDENSVRRGCPNLIDTYLLTSAQEQNRLLQKPVDGKDFSYFVIDSLVAYQAYNYAIRMDRDYFIRYAQNLKNSDPEKYYFWRENTLSMRKNYSEENLAKILQYGSAFERRGQFHVYECNNGWVKTQQIETSAWDSKTNENYGKQDDVWLARNKYGDLLIHTISYRLKPGWTFWAAGGAGVTLVHINDQWEKIRKAPDANLTLAWGEADLAVAKKPIRNANECLSEYEIIDFNQRLIQSGFIIEQFSPQPAVIKDGACAEPSLLLGFLSNNSAQGEEIMQSLKKDPVVNNMELLETRSDKGNLHYLLRLGLHAPNAP